jgi:hypothetical protein
MEHVSSTDHTVSCHVLAAQAITNARGGPAAFLHRPLDRFLITLFAYVDFVAFTRLGYLDGYGDSLRHSTYSHLSLNLEIFSIPSLLVPAVKSLFGVDRELLLMIGKVVCLLEAPETNVKGALAIEAELESSGSAPKTRQALDLDTQTTPAEALMAAYHWATFLLLEEEFRSVLRCDRRQMAVKSICRASNLLLKTESAHRIMFWPLLMAARHSRPEDKVRDTLAEQFDCLDSGAGFADISLAKSEITRSWKAQHALTLVDERLLPL